MITIMKHEIKRFYPIMIIGVVLVVIFSLINFRHDTESPLYINSVIIGFLSWLTSFSIFIMMVKDLKDTRMQLFHRSTLPKRRIILARLFVIVIFHVVVMAFGMLVISWKAKLYFDSQFVNYMADQIYLIPYVMVDRVGIEYISPFNTILNVFLFYLIGYYGAIRYLYESQRIKGMKLVVYVSVRFVIYFAVYWMFSAGFVYLALYMPYLNLFQRDYWYVMRGESSLMINFFFLPSLIFYGLVIRFLIDQSEVLFKHTLVIG